MKISPIAPALWLAAMFSLAVGLIDYVLGYNLFDPIIAVICYLFFQELSKFIAELTMEDENGQNSKS
jgi:hypothetical protein